MKQNGIYLFNEDYRKIINKIPDNSIDLIVTDPPYRITAKGSTGTMGGVMAKKEFMKGKLFAADDLDIADYINELYRVLKPQSHCYIFCNQKNILHFMEIVNNFSDFKWFKNLIWLKDNKIANQYYMTQFEYILFLRKGKAKRIHNCGTSEVLQFPNKKLKDNQKHVIHPTEKPIELLKVLIENSSDEKDIVLDPFVGIGSTVLACKQLNRRFVGTEIDSKYFEVTKERLKKR